MKVMPFNRADLSRASYLACAIGLTIWFWVGSRYPELDRKASLGNSLKLQDVLSFDNPLIQLSSTDSVLVGLAKSYINWLDTNLYGMLFGVILAILILGVLKRRSNTLASGGSLVGALKGTFLGAPLGLCANCATPIALSVYRSTNSFSAAMAVIVASPSFNIVVLTAAMTMLPIYLVVLKVVVVVVLLLVVIPLIDRLSLAPERQGGLAAAKLAAFPKGDAEKSDLFSPQNSFIDRAKYVVRMTIPYMLLSGALGVLVSRLFPISATIGQPVSFTFLLGLAIVGSFLPVPIYFDLILCHMLMMQGVHLSVVAVLFVSLGTFSIYPTLVFRRHVGLRSILLLLTAVILLSLLAGWLASFYYSNPWAF